MYGPFEGAADRYGGEFLGMTSGQYEDLCRDYNLASALGIEWDPRDPDMREKIYDALIARVRSQAAAASDAAGDSGSGPSIAAHAGCVASGAGSSVIDGVGGTGSGSVEVPETGSSCDSDAYSPGSSCAPSFGDDRGDSAVSWALDSLGAESGPGLVACPCCGCVYGSGAGRPIRARRCRWRHTAPFAMAMLQAMHVEGNVDGDCTLSSPPRGEGGNECF